MPLRTQGVFYNTLTAVILERENYLSVALGELLAPVLTLFSPSCSEILQEEKEELGVAVGRMIDQR